MNGLSNSGFALAFYFHQPFLGGQAYHQGPPPCSLLLAIVLAVWWTTSLTLSRLYVGVHSPTDLRGGFVLGLLLIAIWYLIGGALDSWTQGLSLPVLSLFLFVFG